VKAGFDKACQTIEAMQALATVYPNFQFRLRDDLATTCRTRETSGWSKSRLDMCSTCCDSREHVNNKNLQESIGAP